MHHPTCRWFSSVECLYRWVILQLYPLIANHIDNSVFLVFRCCVFRGSHLGEFGTIKSCLISSCAISGFWKRPQIEQISTAYNFPQNFSENNSFNCYCCSLLNCNDGSVHYFQFAMIPLWVEKWLFYWLT